MAGKSKSSGFDSYMRGAGAVQGRKKGPPQQRTEDKTGEPMTSDTGGEMSMPENMPPAGMKKGMKKMSERRKVKAKKPSEDDMMPGY